MSWIIERKQLGQNLDLADNIPEVDDFYGYSVSLSNNRMRLAVGIRYRDINPTGGGPLAINSGQVRVYEKNGGTWNPIGNPLDLANDSPNASDHFGTSVSLNNDGTRVAVGISNRSITPSGGVAVAGAGQVRVYEEVNGTWNQMGGPLDLAALIPESQEHFGHSISLSNDGMRLAVGIPNKNITPSGGGAAVANAGQVRVYEEAAGTWNLVGGGSLDLSNHSPGVFDSFGISVSLNNDGMTLAVGIQYRTITPPGGVAVAGAGQVRVYEDAGGVWNPVGGGPLDLMNHVPEAIDQFGYSVSLNNDGTRVAVGIPNRNITPSGGGTVVSSAGQVRVYERSSGTWNQMGGSLDLANHSPETLDQFGYIVSLSNDGMYLVVGIPSRNITPTGGGAAITNAGQARVYEEVNGTWNQIGNSLDLANDSPKANDHFGISVSSSNYGIELAVSIYNRNITPAGGGAAVSNAGQVRVYDNQYTSPVPYTFTGTNPITMTLPLPQNVSGTVTSTTFSDPSITLIKSEIVNGELLITVNATSSVGGFTVTVIINPTIIYTDVNITAQEEICLLKDTEITTDQGKLLIQDITTKNTINGQNIKEISTQLHSGKFILFKKHCFCYDVPNKDTYITGRHRVCYKDKVDYAKNWINDDTILEHQVEDSKRVYNIWLDKPRVGRMYANNISVETLDPLIFKTRAKPYNMKMVKR